MPALSIVPSFADVQAAELSTVPSCIPYGPRRRHSAPILKIKSDTPPVSSPLLSLPPANFHIYSTSPDAELKRRQNSTVSIFPLSNYPQEVDKWIPPTDEKYKTPLLSPDDQAKYYTALLKHYYGQDIGDESPWNKSYIESVLGSGKSLETDLKNFTVKFTGSEAQFYGANFRVLDDSWKTSISKNALVPVAETYKPSSRGIVLKQTNVRALPTIQPAFYDPTKAGQGFPFDELQMSMLHPGVPIYIAGTSQDKAWTFVISPSVRGWVQSRDIASTHDEFVRDWMALAKTKLGAVIDDSASFTDQEGVFQFEARIGTLLPLARLNESNVVAIPVKNLDGKAQIKYVPVDEKTVASAPLPFTAENFSVLIKGMIGKGYGWGNHNRLNDCSAEIRNMMLPFGIFLPKNSAAQAASGKNTDISSLTPEQRVDYIMEKGVPFKTLLYFPGHIMLYTGNTSHFGSTVPMTYQNIWGLKPPDGSSRSVIGKAVFFPLLLRYPEDGRLINLIDRPRFNLIDL
jgi:cell wall-associated NlpC family hydrolase